MTKQITRSTVNKEQYAAPEFEKSGFNLSYSKHTSFILGRLHVSGIHYTMPGDKIYGKNSGDLTFNRIVTPLVTPSDVGQYNLYLPLRALDTSFEQGMTPTQLNAMSADWHTPKCNTQSLYSAIRDAYANDDENAYILSFSELIRYGALNPNNTLADAVDDDVIASLSDFLYGTYGVVSRAIASLTDTDGVLYKMADKMYLADALQDIADNITVKLGSSSNPISDQLLVSDFSYLMLDALFSPWIGRYSYYAELRYNYLRPFDIYRITRGIGMDTQVGGDYVYYCLDSTPLCEYALRFMYAVWYERFRDVHLEPVSKTLPNWRQFGSTSIFDLSVGGNLCYLLYRIRSWYNDPFTTAQIDDLSRHVYAPIISNSGPAIVFHSDDNNNLDTQESSLGGIDSPQYAETFAGNRKPAIYTLGYHNQLTGENVSVSCPVPSNINDVLANVDKSFADVYGLDLNTLRQSQMLEKYLKRNYLFGDEYQDRMLAHYNSRVSDMRINKPEILGQSLNQSEMSQEISNVSTDETKVGDRTATSTVQFGGDDYGTFCEEFGIVINLLTIMPHAMYDGLDQHLLLDQQQDFPLPEFAANNEEFGRKSEIAGSGLAPDLQGDEENTTFMFGRYPAYHIWRGRVDEVGGMFLDELQDSTFRRFWGLFSNDTTPKLNYWFLHCRPNLGMFANTNRYDCQVYGTVKHDFFVERVLPTPVEVI